MEPDSAHQFGWLKTPILGRLRTNGLSALRDLFDQPFEEGECPVRRLRSAPEPGRVTPISALNRLRRAEELEQAQS
jgi:hypothetical protein